MTTRALSDVFVRGVPQPKGSVRAFIQDGHPIVTSTTKGLKSWQNAIAFVLQSAWDGPPLDGAVSVELTFYLLRPASVPERRRPWPHVRPDVDKLARAALDAMKGIVFRDDAQVCELVARKVYGKEAGVGIIAATLAKEDEDE